MCIKVKQNNIVKVDLMGQLCSSVLDLIPSPIFVFDYHYKLCFMNDNAKHLLGYSEQEFLQKSWDEIFQLLSPSKQVDTNKVVIEDQINVNLRLELLHKNGSSIPVILSVNPLINEIGQTVGILTFIQDLSEKLKRKELQQLSDFILNSINTGVIAIDNNHKVTTFNTAAEKITKLKSFEVLGHQYEEVFTKIPDPNEDLIKTLVSGEFINNYEFSVDSRSDQILSMDTGIIKNDIGLISGAVSIIRDISSLKLYEKNMQRAEKLAALSEMAAGTAHEIRNPLTSVKGFLQVLDNKFDNKDVEKEYIRIMITEIDNINKIIKDFLLFSKPQTLTFSQYDINTIIEEVCLLVENQAMLKEILIIKDLYKNLPAVNIDSDQIKQLFINLIQNAFQAMEVKGTLTLCTSWNVIDSCIDIIISDTGIGIPKKAINKIFDPFFTTKEVGRGTGLGLTIVHQIVKQHKGQILVSSVEGKGTEFIIKLPAY